MIGGTFGPGYIGYVSYDAGREVEPRAQVEGGGGAREDRGWARWHWARVEDALVYDHARGEWGGFGEWHELAAVAGRRCLRTTEGPDLKSGTSDLKFQISDFRSEMGREAYLAAARRVIEYIRAGDVYQVNLAHRLSGRFEGSARGLFVELMRAAGAWYGGYVEFQDARGEAGGRRAVVSASPELFLEFDARTRRVVTRPMKGTRRGDTDPRELIDSEKDRAELTMIVDLMRNDLGRVCEFGSVRVEKAREVERHGRSETARQRDSETGVLQTTATVSGRVREGLGVQDVLAAAFPGGSVTGAPKIRAMQIIDELEPVRRGPYCGCFGFVGDDGSAALNIAIRTALVSGDRIDYSVGAGIVADSVPEREWEETMEKAGVMPTIAEQQR